MKSIQLLKIWTVGIGLVVGCSWSFAQTGGTLLTGNQVTQDALINALKVEPAADTPADPDAAPVAGSAHERRTRGFKLAPPEPRPVAPPKASFLITIAGDSVKLTKDSNGMLDMMAGAMQSAALSGASFTIEGHADPRGDEAHNLALSQQRAEAVVAYLVDRRGIDRTRLHAVGKGSSELLNTQQKDAPENRRVTFINVTP